ncbi:hypothetical protein M6B38_396725 [Iris pallida]|uniref:Uncharacterized protein n=1 Tax=Iris pallida TaxID=29817 RepID=A0AAX6FVI5_IRIPA|nr:hypothetical protein M6B38_396725 [Iris pallida]
MIHFSYALPAFYTVLDYGTRFCSEEGLQPRSLFGLRVVTRLSNGFQVAFTLCLVFHYTVSYSFCQFTWNCCWCLYLLIFLTGYVDKILQIARDCLLA